MLVHMAAGNKQKHLSLSFATKKKLSIEELRNIKITLFSNTRTVQIAKFPEIRPEISHSFKADHIEYS